MSKTFHTRPAPQWAVIATAASGAALVLFLFPPGEYRFYPLCLFHVVTGLQCPGCGGLRAAHQMLHGHFAAAFHSNPLLILILPLLSLWTGGHVARLVTGRDGLRLLRHPAWLWLLLAAAVAFGIARNLS